MKKILAATDFSDAGHNASLYAADLARAFNARVVLFNAYDQVPVPVSEIPVLTTEEMGIRAEQKLKDEKQLLTAGNWLPVKTVSKPGIAAQTILQTVKEANADLIIAGMKRTDSAIRKLLGSTVTAMVKKLPVSLLIVPEGIPYIKISTIALAYESDIDPDSDPHVLDVLREIGERFHSKLYLVRVAGSRVRNAYEFLNHPSKINKMVRTLDPVYECITGKDIPEALNDFIEAYNINLLALLPHQYSLLERWFHSSITRSMIFESQIPLLIIPEKHKKPVHEGEGW